MKYLICNDVAVLATRGREAIGVEGVVAEIIGVPDGATLFLQNEKGEGQSFPIVSERTVIPAHSLTEGRHSVMVIYEVTMNGETIRHEAAGNPVRVMNDGVAPYILPAPLSSASELERMWQGIVAMMEPVIRHMDEHTNGYDVV